MNENRSGLRLAGTQTLELTQRSLQNEFRQWVVILPGLIFPLMMAAVYSSQFGRALGLPGFPKRLGIATVKPLVTSLLPNSATSGVIPGISLRTIMQGPVPFQKTSFVRFSIVIDSLVKSVKTSSLFELIL